MTETERRKFLKLVGVSLAGAAGMSILGCKPGYTQVELQNPTRKALAERLKTLAESDPPTDLQMGACCYDMIGRYYERKPCPDCGEMMDVGQMDEILLAYNVPVKRIQDLDLDATLILPEHCPACGLGLKEKKFLLEIKYPDDPDFVRVELDSAHDLELMALFLQGKDRWTDEQEGEYALKDKVERLRELFGVKK